MSLSLAYRQARMNKENLFPVEMQRLAWAAFNDIGKQPPALS